MPVDLVLKGAVAGLALVCLLLLLVLVFRRPRVQLPPEWVERLQALEAASRATHLAVAKNDGALDSMGQQLRGFTHSSHSGQEALRKAVDERLAHAVQDSRAARGELSATLAVFRTDLVATTSALVAESVKSREAQHASSVQAQARIQERFEALTQATRNTLDSLKADINTQLHGMGGALRDQLDANSLHMRNQFSALQESVHQQLGGMVQGSQHSSEQLRTALNERLAAIQANNNAQLEEMRRTVDEKLHATLEQRLGESFKLVSDRLEQVHKGLGEMQTLAGSVGDLKRVMTNVKSRGTWGEVQLGAILDNVLTPEQFGRNVKTVPGSDDSVEFAVRLPGKSHETPVWLPIDAKYPVEQYQRLLDAQEAADKPAMLSAGNAFETSIRTEARKISAKYVSPPHTTDFAILYLPSEGLFAEVMRRPGLAEAVQTDCRVMLTGPTNLAAMLSSLQMGFKTLAIEKRSSEVWALLGTVKTEFGKFGDAVEATKKSLEAAAKRFDQVDVRTRAIQRKLRDVQDLPAPELAALGLVAEPDAEPNPDEED